MASSCVLSPISASTTNTIEVKKAVIIFLLKLSYTIKNETFSTPIARYTKGLAN